MAPSEEGGRYGETGPIVRPYLMTRGRTEPARGEFDLITLVMARPATQTGRPATLSPEQVEIVACCEEPLSVAEIAAQLDLPLGTVRVLLGDLLEAELIDTHQPLAVADAPPGAILQAVLVGLRAL
ncbi:DUF742 domain-containing protein [Micromonospora sp. NPDC049679]|uniref:DUF742 domain-containing protein n=1 Tax=Micromonospora sp. NPDC049679 TaxID=3155920 RepID=UPI00340EBA3D